MNGINMILMIVLCTMIGFIIGNACGKESMKKMVTGMIQQIIDGAKNTAAMNSKPPHGGSSMTDE